MVAWLKRSSIWYYLSGESDKLFWITVPSMRMEVTVRYIFNICTPKSATARQRPCNLNWTHFSLCLVSAVHASKRTYAGSNIQTSPGFAKVALLGCARYHDSIYPGSSARKMAGRESKVRSKARVCGRDSNRLRCGNLRIQKHADVVWKKR